MKQVKSRHYVLCLLAILFITNTKAGVYQWSVPVTGVVSGETNQHPQAFLWIPGNCEQVRGVILGQHNLSEENKIIFTAIPPRAKFPIKVTVVAWQYGKSVEPKVQTAEAVERTFFIVN